MAWTSLTFTFGSLLTSSKMTQLYDNIAAAFNKDSGAPQLAIGYVTSAMLLTDSVSNSKIRAAAVTIAKLSFASGSISGSIVPNGVITISLNKYSHMRQTYCNAINEDVFFGPRQQSSSLADGLAIINTGSDYNNYGVNWDYHN